MSDDLFGVGNSYDDTSSTPAVKRINDKLKLLRWSVVEKALSSTDRDDEELGFEVCEASLEVWENYVETENQVLRSQAMEFHDGKIYIVELPTQIHDVLCRFLDGTILDATGTGMQHLKPCGGTYVASFPPRLEPDCSFGPDSRLGAVRPDGISWGEYHTLKVEIGVTRTWRQLDRKADEWRQIPGVEYILCIHLSHPKVETREFKLHSVVNTTTPLPVMTPIPITNTKVNFDSRRLLGISGNLHVSIPPGFAEPNVVMDLSALVEELVQFLFAP